MELAATDSNGAPVLLLPGRTSGVPMWSENLTDLLAHHSVIAVDALGDAGLSLQSSPLTSTEDQAIWVDEVVRRLAPEGVHLVGHSFGGATAVTYARLHPERVRSLVLLEPVFTFAYPPAGLMAWTVLASLPVLPEAWRERALAEVGGGERAAPGDPIASMINAGAAHYRAQLPNPRLLSDPQLAALTMPVYVAVADSHSLAGGPRAADRARQLPHSTVESGPTRRTPCRCRSPARWTSACRSSGPTERSRRSRVTAPPSAIGSLRELTVLARDTAREPGLAVRSREPRPRRPRRGRRPPPSASGSASSA